jgi:protein-disulfide isomerase
VTLGFSRRFLLVLTAVFAFAPPALAAIPASEPDDMALGSAKAPVQVIEYASASCPHCARFNNDVFPAFKKKYIDTGKVHYVFREYFTEPVQVAGTGFLLARCVPPGKYFQVLDDFFHGQAKMYETGDLKGLVVSAGKNAGMTEEQTLACFDNKPAADAMNARVLRHANEGVESTPTFIINGTKLADLDHEVALADLDTAVEPLLKAKAASKAKAGPKSRSSSKSGRR